jgi:hypothetical protein
LIASEIGEREFDRMTASECLSAGRPSQESENRGIECPDSRRRTKQLRAINCAPEIIQRLYDQDLLAVDLAANEKGARRNSGCGTLRAASPPP